MRPQRRKNRNKRTRTHVTKFTQNLSSFYRKGQDRPLTGAKVSLHLDDPHSKREKYRCCRHGIQMVIKNLFQLEHLFPPKIHFVSLFLRSAGDKRAKDIRELIKKYFHLHFHHHLDFLVPLRERWISRFNPSSVTRTQRPRP